MDYPVVESIQSILSIVDELIVLIGDGSDSTEELIKSIPSEKIKVHRSVWNPDLKRGGAVLAEETNKAFQLIDPAADWAFYLQADEVIHEKGLPSIVEACHRYKDDKRVDVLVLPYKNFFATYDYVGDSRRWIAAEGRIIKNDKSITSYRDAQGFRRDGKKLKGVLIANAFVFHYSWVKSPEQMGIKEKFITQYWSDEYPSPNAKSPEVFDYMESYDSVVRFTGTHPTVMVGRIKRKNWHIDLDTTQKKFNVKDRILYWVEKRFGKRLFEFRNYKLLPP
jgi:hypothetical protein